MLQILPLFVYGTLMWTDVLKAVIGRNLPMEDAVIEGYRRLKIKDVVYPALTKAPSFNVKGKLIRGLEKEELCLIDRFEGEEYERREVFVRTSTGIEPAFAYIFKDSYFYLLLEEDWNPSEITEEIISRFIVRETGNE